MDRSKQLGEGKMLPLLLKFSIPAMVGMIVNALYNIVDRIFIGNGVGTDGIAGVTIGFPIMLILMAFTMLIGIGSTSLLSIRLGEKKKEEAEQIIGNGLMLLVGTAVLLMVAGLVFLEPLLRAFGASEAVLPYAAAYMQVILIGTVFQFVGFGMNGYIRALESPKIAMMTMLIGAVLNTILDPIFIFVFGWGVRGAAIATIFSQMVSAVWVLFYFFRKSSYLRIYARKLKLHAETVLKILMFGLPPFLMQLAASLLNAIMNKGLITYGGDVAVSAVGIVNSIAMMILMPIFGINQGVQPIIGYNYGARNFNRVKEALKLAIIGATIIVTIGFIITRVIPGQLVALFNRNDPELIRIGTRAVTIFLSFLPIIGFQIISSNYFQAVGKPKQAMILTLSRQILFLIPALLILPLFFGLDGIFYAGPLADLLASIVTGLWLFVELRHLNVKHLETL